MLHSGGVRDRGSVHRQTAELTYVDQNRIGDHICYYSDLRKMQGTLSGWSITRPLPEVFQEIVECLANAARRRPQMAGASDEDTHNRGLRLRRKPACCCDSSKGLHVAEVFGIDNLLRPGSEGQPRSSLRRKVSDSYTATSACRSDVEAVPAMRLGDRCRCEPERAGRRRRAVSQPPGWRAQSVGTLNVLEYCQREQSRPCAFE